MNANDLADDIKNDTNITDSIPADALPAFNNFAERLAIHITAQIQRGAITDVQVSLGTGTQQNVSYVI